MIKNASTFSFQFIVNCENLSTERKPFHEVAQDFYFINLNTRYAVGQMNLKNFSCPAYPKSLRSLHFIPSFALSDSFKEQ